MIEKPLAALGIDPGMKGALILLSEDDLIAHDFKSVDDAETALEAISQKFDIGFTVLEKVWFRPNERDVKSVEVLIRNHEMWHTLLHVFKIPHETYSPDQWRAGLIRSKGQKEKKIYIERAKQLMPEHSHMFTRHDRAEAALMAWRAWMHVQASRKLFSASFVPV